MKITQMVVRDVRFPTSLEGDGSDAVHDPDYSCGYVILKTDTEYTAYGLTFTLGRGNELVCAAIEAYRHLVVGRDVTKIFDNFCEFWRELTQENQMRWVGPEKGVTHLAAAGIINALWDLWARMEGKEPEKLVSTMDFTYIEDVLTKEEAIEILKKGKVGQAEREAELSQNGYPAYITSAGWLGYDDNKIKQRCKEYMNIGFDKFKVKVGVNLEDDKRRVGLIRKEIGENGLLMVDANQRWGVNEAISWMKELADYRITWIEEPTSPDDILGHAQISKSLAQYGIGVATGECCQNRVMFKQFLQSGALQYCQIDSCRLAGPNEIMTVVLMAAKYGVPVCPHAGGVGLCELVQHYSFWDYISVSRSLENRMIECSDHLHDHFVAPALFKNGTYQIPTAPGFSVEMFKDSIDQYVYPDGPAWRKLFTDGLFKHP